ncbi:hypothetical protein XENOCAPTIV_010129 [Xenoophorus captivus]|uniref:Uncharacterized protein n=1 Tax=Xenoophorus captivus TaxID=1517983 RepID=A0ABV0QS87_9TELE
MLLNAQENCSQRKEVGKSYQHRSSSLIFRPICVPDDVLCVFPEWPTHGEPKLCSQCGSVLDSRQKDEVKACYFCKFGDLTRPPSLSKCPLNGQKDELFLLTLHEHPLSASNSLLLFCIDSSGSMSITSKVTMHGCNHFQSQLLSDGKANAKLGNLEEEDNDARALLSSTIFYQDLGESAANQGRMKGEREAGHKGTREVGNVNNDTEVTIQFVANEDIEVVAPASGSRVFIQLQIRYKKNGQALLRVITAEREVTDDRLLLRNRSFHADMLAPHLLNDSPFILTFSCTVNEPLSLIYLLH